MPKPQPKKKRYVNKKHLAYVTSLPCMICGRKARAHHVKTKGAGGGDHQTVPLCSAPDWIESHHGEVHRGYRDFEQYYGINLREHAFDCWASSPHNEVGVWDEIGEDLSNV